MGIHLYFLCPRYHQASFSWTPRTREVSEQEEVPQKGDQVSADCYNSVYHLLVAPLGHTDSPDKPASGPRPRQHPRNCHSTLRLSSIFKLRYESRAYAFLSDNFKKSFRKACHCDKRDQNQANHQDYSATTRRSRRGPRFTAVPPQESNDEDKEGGDLSTGITITSRSSKYNCSTSS